MPGVGDSTPTFQKRLVKTWYWWGVEPELLQMNWASQESWSDKLSRLIKRIDELRAQGDRVALVGASAGGAAVICAFTERSQDIAGVICLCGKLKNARDIGQAYRQTNPSLVDAVEASDESLTRLGSRYRGRILTRRAFYDEVVTNSDDSQVEGARNRVSLTVGHAATIGLQLIFGAPSFLSFLKRDNT